MGKVIITDDTCKNPITMIGRMVGLCYGSDTSNDEKNYKRGYNCITSGHGRTIEFPDVYMHIEGYSARVIRELYTHIGGSPTRVQESTRYIDYSNFEYENCCPDLTALLPADEAETFCGRGLYRDVVDVCSNHFRELGTHRVYVRAQFRSL